MDYSKTIIYKIVCNDITVDHTYVGHTTNFIKRKGQHKNSCNNENSNDYHRKVYKTIREYGGWENWTMIQIEEYNCNNKREAETKERYWMETLKANLNCVNPITTKEEMIEKAKEHYEENKEYKIEYQKKYAEENSEEIKEYQDYYRTKNKEILSEKKKEYRVKHKEEAVKANKQWREANKEKIKQEKSQIINCECGSKYTFGNKDRHIDTKKHREYYIELSKIIYQPLIKELQETYIQELQEIYQLEKKTDEEILQEKILEKEENMNILKQKQKEYRENNSEKIKEQKKIYNETNKLKISEKTKQYYETHKEEIIEKCKNYVEENKEKVKKTKQEWYETNKEKILSKQKQLFTCECGSEVRCAGRAEHNRSSKHLNHIENISQKI